MGEYNGKFQYFLKDNECLYSDEPCNFSDSTSNSIQLSDMCTIGDNILTEDACYNWYVYSVYPKSNDVTSDQYNKNLAISTMKTACQKYPHNEKCTCVNVIKDNASKSFTFASDPSKAYNVSCIYDACSRFNMSYDPENPRPYLPDEIANNDDISCPENLCSISMNNTTVNMTDGSTLNLKNECGRNNPETDDSSSDKSVASSKTEETLTDKINKLMKNKKILITVVVIIVVMFLLLLIIILLKKRKPVRRRKPHSNSKNDNNELRNLQQTVQQQQQTAQQQQQMINLLLQNQLLTQSKNG